jgi:hypothetical protein
MKNIMKNVVILRQPNCEPEPMQSELFQYITKCRNCSGYVIDGKTDCNFRLRQASNVEIIYIDKCNDCEEVELAEKNAERMKSEFFTTLGQILKPV